MDDETNDDKAIPGVPFVNKLSDVIAVVRTPRLATVRASVLAKKYGITPGQVKLMKLGGSVDLPIDKVEALVASGYVQIK